MADQWPEFDLVTRENRRELTLNAEIDKRISDHGFPHSLFKLKNLNYLEITMTCIECFPDGVKELSNLTSLVLRGNKLVKVTGQLGELLKLKMLDLSNNKLVDIPSEIGLLPSLQSLNCGMNCLETFPPIGTLKMLHILDISNNKLTSFPDGIGSEQLIHLADIKASHNQIQELPATLGDLLHLKSLDVSNNNITIVPIELSNCAKLKDLDLTGNKLSDQKLFKFANDNHCTTKTVLDYLAVSQDRGKSKAKVKRKKKGKKDDVNEDEELLKDCIRIVRFPTSGGVTVTVTPAVLDVRPFILCCIIRNLDLDKSSTIFKKFINLQTKLHESICEQRRAGTIATHDLRAVHLPLVYDAVPQQLIKIQPLFRNKEYSATELVSALRKEADDLRKEKKRNAVSGVHKYLDLLKDKELYPCLVDNNEKVISFPPITNSDATKINSETRDILLEVTSSVGLESCKKIADAFLLELLELDASRVDTEPGGGDELGADEPGGGAKRKELVVEQVKVTDRDGGLRAVFPSRTDLAVSHVCVIRD